MFDSPLVTFRWYDSAYVAMLSGKPSVVIVKCACEMASGMHGLATEAFVSLEQEKFFPRLTSS